MENEESKLTYKFKYIYLILIIVILLVIIILYSFPIHFAKNDITFFGLDFKSENNVEVITVNILKAIFLSFLTALILSFFYEYKFKSEERKEIKNIINNIFQDNLEPLVVNAILSKTDIHTKLFNSEIIDKILQNCLSIKINDVIKANVAKEIMDSLINNLIGKVNNDIIEGLYISLTLTEPSNNEKIKFNNDAYKVEYNIEYRTKLKSNNFNFIVTNDRTIQKNNLGVFSFSLYLHFFNPYIKNIFEIREIKIDEHYLNPIGKPTKNENFISYNYGNNDIKTSDEMVKISYKVAFLLKRNSHSFFYLSPFITRNIHLTFDANNISEINRIITWTYFNSNKEPLINYYDKKGNYKPLYPTKIDISVDDWILPFSGAAFVWQFEEKNDE
jgi:hypothetical protein